MFKGKTAAASQSSLRPSQSTANDNHSSSTQSSSMANKPATPLAAAAPVTMQVCQSNNPPVHSQAPSSDKRSSKTRPRGGSRPFPFTLKNTVPNVNFSWGEQSSQSFGQGLSSPVTIDASSSTALNVGPTDGVEAMLILILMNA